MLFAGIDAAFQGGDLVAVTGPSGCGKSTFLALMAGWMEPSQGRVDREGIGAAAWVFQNPHGVARRTALDHVALPLLALGRKRGAATRLAEAILGRFNLDHLADQQFRSLSGGEAQRLMLARAVASGPDLLLVDEPTAQLDRRTAASVNSVLANLASERAIVLVATHDPETRLACSQVLDLAAKTETAVSAMP
jgi:ABC-type lipoprotein export system ATPase subunit